MGLLSKFIFSDMEIHNKPRQEMEYHFLLPNQVNVQRIDSFNEPEEFKYSYRFVCFMDMLGCKDLVWKSETSQDAFEQVKKLPLYSRKSKGNTQQIIGVVTLFFLSPKTAL